MTLKQYIKTNKNKSFDGWLSIEELSIVLIERFKAMAQTALDDDAVKTRLPNHHRTGLRLKPVYVLVRNTLEDTRYS